MGPIIIYHGGCPDGFCSAWVAHRYYSENGRTPELYPARYGDDPPDIADRDVLIVDFSYPKDVLTVMAEQAKSIRLFDHHKTAQADLDGLPFAVFDMNESGASLTWRELYETEPPPIVRYVRDRDLWLWEELESKVVSAYIMAQPHEVEAWNYLLALDPIELIARGKIARMVVERFVEHQAKKAYGLTFADLSWIAVNTPQQHVSDVLGHLVENWNTPALGWFFDGERIALSFRSGPSLPDVSDVARSFGGGGHRNAAGGSLPISDIARILPQKQRRR